MVSAAWGLISFATIPVALAYLRSIHKDSTNVAKSRNITILYGTTTGTSRRMAHEFKKKLGTIPGVVLNVFNMKDYEFDSLDSENIVFVLCSTWNYGKAPESAQPFMEWLKDLANDFRVSKNLLGNVRFAVMGLGGEVYGEHYCTAVCILSFTCTGSCVNIDTLYSTGWGTPRKLVRSWCYSSSRTSLRRRCL